jgi:hypothetical protein
MFETFKPSLAFLLHILASRQNVFSYSGFITFGVTFYEEFPHQNSKIVPSSIRAISHVDGTVIFLKLTGANHSKAAEYHDLEFHSSCKYL